MIVKFNLFKILIFSKFNKLNLKTQNFIIMDLKKMLPIVAAVVIGLVIYFSFLQGMFGANGYEVDYPQS